MQIPGTPVRIPTHPTAPIPAAKQPPSAHSAAVPLLDELPTYVIAAGYFNELTVPGASYSCPAGNAAWYGLQSIRIDDDFGEEGAFLSVAADLRPCDQSGGATSPSGGTVRAWGDVHGIHAAIVVGVDLPVRFDEWTAAPCHLPGLVAEGTGLRSSSRGPSPYLWRSSFPSGKWSDTIPQRNYLTVSTAPLVRRLTRGHSLDIAFVLRRDYATANATGVFVGFADVCAVIGRRRGADPFQQ